MKNVKLTNKENRMAALNNAGIDTNKFFNINLTDIPVGTPVQVIIDGITYNLTSKDTTIVNNNFHQENFMNDNVAKSIMDNGYVFNRRIDGRFVTAQTFKMLNSKSLNRNTNEFEYGWDSYLRNEYGYMYQFDMMLEELKRLARMEKDKDIEFIRLSNFFTKTVVVATCKQYIRQLKKYINNLPFKKCRRMPYVKLNKHGNVFLTDLQENVFSPLEKALNCIETATTYNGLYNALKYFMSNMSKLPNETPKCPQWKDAFKGKGAYVTLLNIVKFHNVKVTDFKTGKVYDRDQSIDYIYSLLSEYKGEYWRFHELLKTTIKQNQFDLRKSIESQK